MTTAPEDFDAIVAKIRAIPTGEGRVLVAIAGPPASGKSTLAGGLVARLRSEGMQAVEVPMDGFHLDNVLLDARGLRHRKGAPETFDAAGFVHAMRRLKAGGEVVLPAFDRALDLAIAGRICVGTEDRIVVVEGNYLCFNQPPWDELASLWDVVHYLDIPEAELERRLMQRWRSHGLSEAEAARKTQENDLPNARLVRSSRPDADR